MNDEYRVIKIIDDKTIVINVGENNGVKSGNKFQIYAVGEHVIDPETNEDLGTLNTVKEVVSAIDVFPNMTICRHIETNYYNPLTNFVSPFATQKIDTEKSLNVETTQITGGLSSDLTIKIGDKVRFMKNESENE